MPMDNKVYLIKHHSLILLQLQWKHFNTIMLLSLRNLLSLFHVLLINNIKLLFLILMPHLQNVVFTLCLKQN